MCLQESISASLAGNLTAFQSAREWGVRVMDSKMRKMEESSDCYCRSMALLNQGCIERTTGIFTRSMLFLGRIGRSIFVVAACHIRGLISVVGDIASAACFCYWSGISDGRQTTGQTRQQADPHRNRDRGNGLHYGDYMRFFELMVKRRRGQV